MKPQQGVKAKQGPEPSRRGSWIQIRREPREGRVLETRGCDRPQKAKK